MSLWHDILRNIYRHYPLLAVLETDVNVNADGSFDGSALQAVSQIGHVEVVKLLLEKGANANAEEGLYGSALQAASAGGHVEVMKLLEQSSLTIARLIIMRSILSPLCTDDLNQQR